MIPVGPGGITEVCDTIAGLGLEADVAKSIIDILRSIGELERLGNVACDQRDAWRELAEVWSAETAQLQIQNDALRGLVKDALDWLASFDHEAALKIRLAAEKI